MSPRIVEVIANGSAPADLTVTRLARALPHGGAAQENKFGIAWRLAGAGHRVQASDHPWAVFSLSTSRHRFPAKLHVHHERRTKSHLSSNPGSHLKASQKSEILKCATETGRRLIPGPRDLD